MSNLQAWPIRISFNKAEEVLPVRILKNLQKEVLLILAIVAIVLRFM